MPHIARYFLSEVSTPPKWCDTPPWYLLSHRHSCAIPHFATHRRIIVRYPTQKKNRKYFCDTIVASIARYEKYRYWASKSQNARLLRGLTAPSEKPLSEWDFPLRAAGLVFRAEKTPKHKDISPRIPCLNPPFLGAFNP